MSFLASLLLGCSVTLITLAVWPAKPARRDLVFVEDSSVPRTLH